MNTPADQTRAMGAFIRASRRLARFYDDATPTERRMLDHEMDAVAERFEEQLRSVRRHALS